MLKIILFGSLVLCTINASGALVRCQDKQQEATAVASGGDLHFTVPAEWVSEKPPSKVRVAQFKLPKAEGDKEDGQLVIYYFGESGGGSVSANIERWISQMQQPEGAAAKEPKTDSLTVNNLKISTVDVAGTYTAEMAPGSSEHHNDPNYRLRAAVIETPKGYYYLKVVGPQKTIERWNQVLDRFVRSFEFN